MAVIRQSQGSNPTQVGQTQIQQSQQGNATPDVNKFLQGGEAEVAANVNPDDNLTSRDLQDAKFLDQLLTYGQKFADVKQQQNEKKGYLDGAIGYATGKSKAELEADPTTRAWANAGYSDTKGRLAIADYQAQIAQDMPKLREQSPEQMAQYLKTKQAELLPMLDGMSADATNTVFGQLLTANRSAVAEHTKQRRQFIIDTTSAGVAAGWNVQTAALDRAKGDEEQYGAATLAAATWLHSNVTMNPNLPPDVRAKLTGQAAQYALQGNHQILYQNMKNVPVPQPDGQNIPMLATLPLETQTQLAEAYRKSWKDTEMLRNGEFLNRWAATQAVLEDPKATEVPPLSSIQSLIREGVENGSVSASDGQGILKSYYKAQQRGAVAGAVAGAWAKGDLQQLSNVGATEEEAVGKVQDLWTRNKTPIDQQLSTSIAAGMNGMTSGFKQAGKVVGPAFTQMIANGADQPLNADNVKTVSQVFQAVETAEKNGQQGAQQLMMSTMGPQEQALFATSREFIKQGSSPEQALNRAIKIVTAGAGLPENVRQLRANNPDRQKEDTAIVQDLDDRGLFSTLWSKVKTAVPFGKVAERNANQLAVTNFRPVLSSQPDPGVVGEQMTRAAARTRLSEELAYIGLTNPDLSAQARSDMAYARLASSAVETQDSKFFLPRGSTVQSLFGVPQSVGNQRVGKALDEFVTPLRPPNTESVVYSMSPSGQALTYNFYDKAGTRIGGNEILNKQIPGMVDAQLSHEAEQGAKLFGPGTTVSGSDGSKVQYNGVNTASVAPDEMKWFRENLVKHEAVRGATYPDASNAKYPDRKPVFTGGVGVSTTNPHFPQGLEADKSTWTQAQINNSFAGASNDAANLAMNVNRAYGLNGTSWFLLTAEMMYQSGPGTMSKGKSAGMLEAAMRGDKEMATKLLKETPAYVNAHDVRKKFYERTLNDALNGL